MHLMLDRCRPGNGAALPIAFAIVLVLGAAAGLVPIGFAAPADAATRQFDLYASTLFGWSLTPGGPYGTPTVTVVRGDTVTVTLHSDDGLSHGLFIDYNSNRQIDSSDFVSGTTTGTITFSVPIAVGGTFTFYDPVRSQPFDPDLSPLRGRWFTDRPPVGTILVPTAALSWSGDTEHTISFDAADDDGHAITFELTYTSSDGSGTIRGPSPVGTNPNLVAWTPTNLDATDVVLRLTLTDPVEASTSVDSPAFEVDSTAPSVIGTSPSSGQGSVGVGATVTVQWSEPMDPTSSGSPAAFGVRVAGGPWILGTVDWPDASTLVFTPTDNLSPSTSYAVHVNSSARDDSSPGNAHSGSAPWTFTTTSVSDTTPPTIQSAASLPPVQVAGGWVNLTAEADDDIGIWSVSAQLVGPSFDSNLTMLRGTGTSWYVNRTFTAVGRYNATIWATDAGDNAAKGETSFQIRSAGPSTLPAPASATAMNREDGSVDITWTLVSLPEVAGYKVYRGTISGGPYSMLTPSPLGPGVAAYNDGTVQPGETYYYVVTAVDAAAGESPYSSQAVVIVPPYRGSPLFDPLPWGIAGTTIGVILGAIYGVVWRRRTA